LDDTSQAVVFLSATLWWPTSPRLAMAFLQSGCRVVAICPLGHPLRTVTGVDSIYTYRSLNSIGSLKSAIESARPDLIIPCDDGAVWQLHELYARDAGLRPLIEHSIGSGGAYAALESRRQTLQIAVELGIRVPPTWPIEVARDFSNPQLEWPAVLKLDGTWGGDGVVHVLNRFHAEQVFPSLFGARRTVLAWKQFLVNRHPLALWLWLRRNGSTVTLQKFISGRQATTMFACWQGEVLASVTVEVLATKVPGGAATVLRLLNHQEIESASRLLAQRFKLSGLHGLDFVIDDATQAAYLIEMNPRATQLGHLNVSPQGNLADALSTRLMNRTASPMTSARRIHNDTIALFPHAWKTDPRNQFLSAGYHDVPWEQPALVRELMRDSWPDRRLLNRMLNGLRRLNPRRKKNADPQGGKDHSPLAS
jgi:ATP-grasp domain